MRAADRKPRTDPRSAVRRDGLRIQRREPGARSFWRSLSVLGMVGWPVAFATAGGALLGRFLDTRYETGIRFTLMLIAAGAMAGSFLAWKSVTHKHD